MKRFSWEEIKEYWKIHDHNWAELDYECDPGGLRNVIHPDAPQWLNRYHASAQERTYRKLFLNLSRTVSSRSRKLKALDVGCGAGRWCAFLHDKGYETVGIDLQSKLIELNRQRHPDIEFKCVSIQDFEVGREFDLISSVTVLQHNPFNEQEKVIQKMRELIKPGGYVIILENIHDQGPQLFSNSIEKWKAKFEKYGFQTIVLFPYSYNPFSRFVEWATQNLLLPLFPSLRQRRLNKQELSPELLVPKSESSTNFFKKVSLILLRFCILFDGTIEPILVTFSFHFANHCAFLFKRVH